MAKGRVVKTSEMHSDETGIRHGTAADRREPAPTPKEPTPPPATAVDPALEILTPNEAADLLRVSRATLYRLLHAGDIPGKRVGGRWRFSRRALVEWVEGDGNDGERVE